MDIKTGEQYKGNVNNEIFKIVKATDKAVTFEVVGNGKTFTVGSKMFEHCYLTKL